VVVAVSRPVAVAVSTEPPPHLAVRPLWLCRACAAPWPCGPARRHLRREYAPDRVGLSVYLAGVLYEATADLLALGTEVTPKELFERFLAWTRPTVSTGTARRAPMR
jgi:hypothetical protein